MKKLLSLVLLFAALISVLSGCGGGVTLSGTELAKLLLADQRLDSSLLHKEGDIFSEGVAAMNGLSERATANLSSLSFSNGKNIAKGMADVYKGDVSGQVTIDGDDYRWSNFAEYNNSYASFKETTENIIAMANAGAELINYAKKNLRVTGKWIAGKFGGVKSELFLNVDSNSEIIMLRYENILEMCRRYKDSLGRNVYELYRESDSFKTRMTYIPGVRFEMSTCDSLEHIEAFVADNSKGYWEVLELGQFETHYNVTCYVMKDDVSYSAFYSPEEGGINTLKMMSADRASEIIWLDNRTDVGNITVHFGSFDGIDNVYIDAQGKITTSLENTQNANVALVPVGQMDIDYEYPIALPFGDNLIVNLENGKTIAPDSSFVGGKVSVVANRIHYFSDFGYTGETEIMVQGSTVSERLEAFKSFLAETGLTCRTDIDSILINIDRAYTELDSFVKYYRWNGIRMYDLTGLNAGRNAELDRFEAMKERYLAVDNREVIDSSDAKAMAKNMKFPDITANSFTSASIDGLALNIGSASLSVKDTLLCVVGERYTVNFALYSESVGLVHLESEVGDGRAFADEDVFEVSTSETALTLPMLTEGEYTVVAYISTLDGIRASAYVPVIFDSVSASVNTDNISLSAERMSDGTARLRYNAVVDVEVNVTSDNALDYAAFYELCAQEAYKYGVPDARLEVYSEANNGYTTLTGSETAIGSGTYRITYSVMNGGQTSKGYVILHYTAPTA